MHIKKPHTLVDYSIGYEADGDSWSKGICLAARAATSFAFQVRAETDQNVEFLKQFVPEFDELPWPEVEPLLEYLRGDGILSWDPGVDLFYASATPTIHMSCRQIGPHSHVCRTIMFSDEYARPMAIVPMQGLHTEREGSDGRNTWRILSVMIFGTSSDGGDVDRPIVQTFTGQKVVLPG